MLKTEVGEVMLKFLSKAVPAIVLAALCLGQPIHAQDTMTAQSEATTPSTASSIDEINKALDKLAIELMKTLPPDGTYALKSANDTTSGVPDDLLTQITSSLQSSLMLASDFQITIIDQSQLKEAWAGAIEFNGADFENLVANANFDALSVIHARATEASVDLSVQAVGATSENAGQTIASSQTVSVAIDWNKITGVDVKNFDDKLAILDTKIESVKPKAETRTAQIERVTYNIFANDKLQESDTAGANDEQVKIVATVGTKKLVAFKPDEAIHSRIFWQGDFDNNGYNDVVITTSCGGNGCPDEYKIIRYKGNQAFTTHKVDFPGWPTKVEIRSKGFHNVLYVEAAGNTGESKHETYEFEVINDELSATTSEKAHVFAAAEFGSTDAEEQIAAGAHAITSTFPTVSWKTSIMEPPVPGLLICSYWERWQVYLKCEYESSENGDIYLFHASADDASGKIYCNTISILEEHKDGVRLINCDFSPMVVTKIDKKTSEFFRLNSLNENVETEKKILGGGRPAMGVAISNITENTSLRLNLKSGAEVKEVFSGPARDAGMEVGDVIKQISHKNGTCDIDGKDDLISCINGLAVGDDISIWIFGRERKIKAGSEGSPIMQVPGLMYLALGSSEVIESIKANELASNAENTVKAVGSVTDAPENRSTEPMADLVISYGPLHTPDQRAALQEIFTTWGIYKGAIDGKWGQGTKKSLMAFFDVVNDAGVTHNISNANDFVALVNKMLAPEYAQFFEAKQLETDVSGFEGRYDFSGSCKEGSDSGLTVTASSFEYYEASCQILSASLQGDGKQDLKLSCSGEGEEWQSAISVFKDEAGDLFIESDGDRYRYEACR